MGHSLCSFILRQIPRRSPTHNAVYFTTTRLGGYSYFTAESPPEQFCNQFNVPSLCPFLSELHRSAFGRRFHGRNSTVRRDPE